ncbi:sialidase family protein [Asticcacaulis sp. AC460]|uniref:sialidase family protein n=1 Tax=Asticcacaulis sp. AC460 TaxID=1282360 RepID=UPI00042638F8|nr:sialidase family protein [Asticcacaulis sp. AC460]
MNGKAIVLAGMLALVAGCVCAEPYSWQTIPFQGGGFVDGFLFHPKTPNILYARTDVGGAYRYDYANRRWVPLMDGFGRDDWDCFGVMTFAVDPNAPQRLYATCGLYLSDRVPDGGVIRSEDQGATWQKTTLKGIKLGGNAMGRGAGERLQVDPNNGDVLWLGTPQNGLLKSTDRGQSFSRVAAFVPKAVTTVLIDGKTIYAGSGDTGDGLYCSVDGGETFKRIEGSPKMIPHQMALDTDGTLYVTFADALGPWGVSDGAVWKLKGDVWTDITPAKPSKELTFGYSGLDLDRQHPGSLVVATSNRYSGVGDDIYLSRDGGATWKPFKSQAEHKAGGHPWLLNYMKGDDEDSTARKEMGHWMDALKINPFNSEELLYGTGYGVWMTRNLSALEAGGAVVFDFENENFEETVILGLESPPKGPKVLMAAGDVSGSAWHDLSQTPSRGLFSPTHETNQGVAFAALAPNIIVRSADNEAISGYISYDGADSWQPLPAEPPPLQTKDWNNNRSGKIAISAKGRTMIWVPENHPAYYSSDGGKTWTLSKGWPAPQRGQEPIADKVNDATFYMLDRVAGQVLVSRDRGQSFGLLVGGLPAGEGQLRAVPGREEELWLASGSALYRIVKGQPVAVAGVDQAWQVTFGKAAKGKAYPAVFLWGMVSGEEGLWRSDDEGVHWTRINTDATRFGRMRAIAGDPREHGVLYIAPDGRGIMVGRPQ